MLNREEVIASVGNISEMLDGIKQKLEGDKEKFGSLHEYELVAESVELVSESIGAVLKSDYAVTDLLKLLPLSSVLVERLKRYDDALLSFLLNKAVKDALAMSGAETTKIIS